MRKALWGFCCLMTVLFASGSPANAEPLSIATSEWRPYGYLENGKPAGFASEIVDKVFAKMGLDYRIEFMPWTRALDLAKIGETDAVYSFSYNSQRAEFVMYPETPLHPSEYVFFIRKSDANKLKFDTLDDLKGHKVGITKGYSYSEEFLKKLDELKNFEEADSDELNFEKLGSGKIDYFPEDLLSGLVLLKKRGLQEKITYLDNRVIIKDYFIAFSTKSPKITPEFVKNFSQELKSFIQTDDYRKIHDRYYRP